MTQLSDRSGRRAGAAVLALAFAALTAHAADITFASYGDPHYGAEGGETNWVYRINDMAGWTYPAAVGGGTIDAPRGVIALGDLINDGGNLAKGTNEWAQWKADYGVNGEGLCKYPVYECFGNHDLNVNRFVQKDIIARNQQRLGLTAISTNGLHYSWDWDGVHFVALGIYPADKWTVENTYSSVHDPEKALEFLKWDLENNVGDSGRPVITLHHYDFLTDWWPDWQKLAYPRELDGYNIILILHGHQGAPYGYSWQGYSVSGQNGSLSVAHITTNNEVILAQCTGTNTWGNTYRKSFTFPDLGRTWNPVPRNGSRNVDAAATELRWRLGAYVQTQDVYFGTDSNEVEASSTPYLADLAAGVTNCGIPAAFLPLEPGREYFWRVDQHNGEKPFSKGKVWSFRARDAVASNDITFYFVSDIHYEDTALTSTKRTVKAMNAVPGAAYPASVGGGTVESARAVLFGGDAASESKQWQYDFYTNDYGLTGDKLLEYPVAPELNGNHDGGLGSIVANGIVARNLTRTNLTAISTNGLHCSWDWDGVHFVSLGVRAGVNTNPYNSHGALEFLIGDLAANVGASGKAVVLYQHFGFDDYADPWWTDAERARMYEAVKDYNIIAIFHGHTHSCSIYKWQGIDIYNAPHTAFGGSVAVPVTTSNGFFVCHVTSNRLTVVERKPNSTWGIGTSKPFYRSYAEAGLPAVLSNGGASNIMAGAATLPGSLLYEPTGAAPTAVTIYWGPTDGGTNKAAWTNAAPLGARSTGAFFANVGGLSARRTYYYRCYAVNAAGESWAPVTASFMSGAAATLDNATGATDIAMSSATLNGTLIATAAAPTSVTIYWGPTDGATVKEAWSNAALMGDCALGAFSAGISNLSARTACYYRCYATNELGEEWAPATASFLTDPAAVVTTGGGATQLTRTGATLNGELVRTYATPTDVYLLWGEGDGGATWDGWSNSLALGPAAVGSFARAVSNLVSDTTYYYRVYATNAAGDAWSQGAGNFTTLSSRPAIANGAADAITRSSATLNGTLVSTGSAPTRVMIYYGVTDGGTNPAAWARSEDLGERPEGALAVSVSSLTSQTQYFYRCYASNLFGVAWANPAATFATPAKTGPFYTWDAGGVAHSPADWDAATNWGGDTGFPNGVGQGGIFTNRVQILDHQVFRLNRTITVGEVRFVYQNLVDDPTKRYIDSFGLPGETMVFATEDGGEAEFRYENSGDTRMLAFHADMVLSNDLHYLNYQNRNGAGILGLISGPGRLRVERYRGATESDFAFGQAGEAPNTYSGGTILTCGSGGNLAGTFNVKKNGAFGSGDVTVGPYERVILEDRGTNDDMIADSASLSLQRSGTNFAKIVLNTGVSETVGNLFFYNDTNAAWEVQSVGTWGSSTSSAAFHNDDFFIGSGIITVTGIGPATEINNASGATGIGSDAATLNGTLVSAAMFPTTIFVCWGEADGDTNRLGWEHEVPVGSRPVGGFAVTITNLNSEATYYYRCLASNAAGLAWAPASASFATVAGGVFTIQAQSDLHGAILPSGAVPVARGSSQLFSFMPDPHWHVADVVVDGLSQGALPEYTFLNVVTDHTISASFAMNITSNSTPEWWLSGHSLTNGTWDDAAMDDQDHDGMPTWQEWKADTDPTNPASVLRLAAFTATGGVIWVHWLGGVGATQYVEASLAPAGAPWVPIHTSSPPTSAEGSLLDGSATNRNLFYRIRANR